MLLFSGASRVFSMTRVGAKPWLVAAARLPVRSISISLSHLVRSNTRREKRPYATNDT